MAVMRKVTQIVFEEHDRAILKPLLAFPHALGVDTDGKSRLGRYLNRVFVSGHPLGGKDGDPFDLEDVVDFGDAISALSSNRKPRSM